MGTSVVRSAWHSCCMTESGTSAVQCIIENLKRNYTDNLCVPAGKYKPMTFDQGPNKGQGPLDGGALTTPQLTCSWSLSSLYCGRVDDDVLAPEHYSGGFASMSMCHD